MYFTINLQQFACLSEQQSVCVWGGGGGGWRSIFYELILMSGAMLWTRGLDYLRDGTLHARAAFVISIDVCCCRK